MNKLMSVLMAMGGLALAVFSYEAAAATECNGVISGTVNGGVVVNAGDFCVLQGARVNGGVRINGGVVFVCGSTINGGIVADGALAIIVGAEEAECDGDVINGGVQISNTAEGNLAPNTPPSIALENSVIHGAVHLTGNLGRMAVAGNSISGGLFCNNNVFDLDDEGNPSAVTGKVTCEFE